jgi:DNA invertase Pin-like site-specific DNA recombinase
METIVNKCKQTAIIFCRCSSSGYLANRQDTSRQVADLKAYADYANLKVVKVFEEHLSGGKKNNERPILNEAIEFCKQEHISFCLVNSLDRIGRNAFEVLATVKELIDNGINLYMQKEQFTLLGDDGKPTMFAPIMCATLSTCAQLERDSISFRLNSGRAQYIRNGGRLGRKKGSVKTIEQKESQYKEVLAYLRKGYSIRITAKLTQVSTSTVQRLKTDFSIY